METGKAKDADGLAGQLRQAIRACGLSLNELERRCGVSHAALSRFLRAERTLTLPLASKVCTALGLVLAKRNDADAKRPHARKAKQ
jgi:transcriptional regulator with XRE-family HTH domain